MTLSRTNPMTTLPASTPLTWSLEASCHTSLKEVDREEWDGLVPREDPHLRYDFLRAVEESGFGKQPHYVRVRHNRRLVGATVAYVTPVDLLTLAPPKYTRWIAALRSRIAPRLLFLGSITCGRLITNCHHNLALADGLTPEEERSVTEMLLREVERIPGGSVITAIEFTEEAAARFGAAMEGRGYLKAPSLPGTRLEVNWNSLDEYVAGMRKAFRRTVLKDRRAAGDIVFEVVDDFSEIGEEAWALYNNVLSRADHVFEKLTPEFFRELGKCEQSRMLTARDHETGRLIGMELLLCGETVLQDLYTGLDYRYNPEQRLYFNLLYPVIGYAGEQGYKTLNLGQTSYQFKARLGVAPYPLYIFVKHRNRLVHRLLSALRGLLFPETEAATFHVFRDSSTGS